MPLQLKLGKFYETKGGDKFQVIDYDYNDPNGDNGLPWKCTDGFWRGNTGNVWLWEDNPDVDTEKEVPGDDQT